MRLTEKVALVTGSTRGLGKAIAERLASEGAIVVVTGRDEAKAREIAESLGQSGGKAIGLSLEVADASSVNRVLRVIEEQVGPVDILVNNAGITRDTLLLRMDDDGVERGSPSECDRGVPLGKRRTPWHDEETVGPDH